MKVNVEKIEKNLIKLDIEVDADRASQEYSKACRKIGENINIPGFRKGKAPVPVIEKYVGEDRIKREALDRMLPSIIADAVSEHQFELVTEPSISSFKFELGEPVTINVNLELKPEVKLNNYKGLEVEVSKFEHPENAIDKELQMLAQRFSVMQPIIDRPTVNTDVVFIDFIGTVGGEPIKGGTARNHQLDLANSNFIPGFAEQLIDKTIGSDFSIKVTFPDNYHDENLKGKEAEFQVKINEIKEKNIPEINDELAQKVGPFKTIEELKKDILTYLEKTAETENKNRAQKAVLDTVVDQADIEVPDSMTNKEAKVLMEEVQGKMKQQGVSWEQVLDSQGHENIWKNLREEALKRIKNSLVFGEIAKAEKIKVTEEQFSDKIKELSIMYNTDEKSVINQISKNSDLVYSLTQQILGNNITEFLVENNVVKYIEDTSS